MTVKGTIGWAKGHLYHYSNPTLAKYLHKLQTYTSLEADKFSKNKLSLFFVLNYLSIKPSITFFKFIFKT